MDIKQVYNLANDVTKEILGESAVIAEDLSNVVDMGKAIFDNTSYDKFVKSLVDHIGKVVFVNRTYSGSTAALYRDNWEYGAVMEKIYGTALPEAVENESWELTNGASYDPNVFVKPDVAAISVQHLKLTYLLLIVSVSRLFHPRHSLTLSFLC